MKIDGILRDIPDYREFLTVDKLNTSSQVASRYRTMFMMGMAMRVADEALSRGPYAGIRDEIHDRMLETVEEASDIEVIPIQKLVRVQLGSGLMIAEHLKNR